MHVYSVDQLVLWDRKGRPASAACKVPQAWMGQRETAAHRFALYAFDVIVNVALTDAERTRLPTIVEYLQPAHTHFVTLVEPAPPAFIDHWELHVSEVGVTTGSPTRPDTVSA